MKNETKLVLIIFSILLVAVGFGWAFDLSLNPQTFQVGYTVFTEKGEKLNGFIPEARHVAIEAQCPSTCPHEASPFTKQCREKGHRVYNGPCCQTFCSGNVATLNEGQSL